MRVSITDAAAKLTALGDRIDRSTLSRYLAQHAEALPTERVGKSTMVDFEALLMHRRENIRVAGPQIGPDALAPTDPTKPGSGPPNPGPTQAHSRARKEAADAEIREIELGQLRKEIVIAREVEDAARDAVGLMRAAFDRDVEQSAADAALRYGWDERTVRTVLKRFAKSGLDTFHRRMLSAIDGEAEPDASNREQAPGGGA